MTTETDSELAPLEHASEHRRRLVAAVDALVAAADNLDSATANELAQIGDRVRSDVFRVMIVGEFKRGKSTLVNALLGANVLPAKAIPCTAVITEVSYAATPEAALYPVDSEAPTVVPVDQLTERIVIAGGADRRADQPSPWRLAQVRWPLELCRNGVVVIDSPGLNEHPVRQEVTLDYLRRADAVVFVQDSQNAASMEEQRFARTFLDAYDLFFVFNKVDNIPAAEVEDVKNYLRGQMEVMRQESHGNDKYFFTNAQAALDAKLSHNYPQLVESGMTQFTIALSTYLVNERHKAKALVTARDIRRIIRQQADLIPDQKALIDKDADDLAQLYDQSGVPLKDLELQAEHIKHYVELQTRHLVGEVSRAVEHRLMDLSRQAPAIVADAVTEEEIRLAPWHVKSDAEAWAEKVAEIAADEASEEFGTWASDELHDLIERRLDEIAAKFERDLKTFLEDLQEVRESLTGLRRGEAIDTEGLFADVMRGHNANAVGNLKGANSKLAVRHILQQLAASFGVLVVVGSFGLLPTAIAMAAVGAKVLSTAKGRVYGVIRAELGSVLAEQISSTAASDADKMAAALEHELKPVFDSLLTRVDGQVDGLRSQVESALAALNEGTEAVGERREALEQIERSLDDTDHEVVGVIEELAAL